jgi:hypothetical protein
VSRSSALIVSKRQAPEHYKSSMFYKTLNWSIVFWCIKLYELCWKHLLHISIPCLLHIPWIQFRCRNK